MQQFGHRYKAITRIPQSVDQSRQSRNGFAAIASCIMKQNHIPFTRCSLVHYTPDDFPGGRFLPVIWVNLQAHAVVTQTTGEYQWSHLVWSFWFYIFCIGWTE